MKTVLALMMVVPLIMMLVLMMKTVLALMMVVSLMMMLVMVLMM